MISENISIPSSHGPLEGVLAYPADRLPWFAVVMAGPHPLLGGDMNNNVLLGLENELVARGGATLRFNYAGVGNSAGPPLLEVDQIDAFLATSRLADEPQRRHDLSAAVDTMRSTLGPEVPLLLVGYSFGCAVIAWWFAGGAPVRLPEAPARARQSPPDSNRPMRRRPAAESPGLSSSVQPVQFSPAAGAPSTPPHRQTAEPPIASLPASGEEACRGVVCIAPTVGRHNYDGLARANVPRLVLASRNDFATSPELLQTELAGWCGPVCQQLAELDDHFFRGCEAWLAEQIVPFFASLLRPSQAATSNVAGRTETRPVESGTASELLAKSQ